MRPAETPLSKGSRNARELRRNIRTQTTPLGWKSHELSSDSCEKIGVGRVLATTPLEIWSRAPHLYELPSLRDRPGIPAIKMTRARVCWCWRRRSSSLDWNSWKPFENFLVLWNNEFKRERHWILQRDETNNTIHILLQKSIWYVESNHMLWLGESATHAHREIKDTASTTGTQSRTTTVLWLVEGGSKLSWRWILIMCWSMRQDTKFCWVVGFHFIC